MRITHPFDPIYDSNSEVLILGSFPSVKSRLEKFPYAHPQNRFWKIIADILKVEFPVEFEDKKIMLKEGKIALWDVLESCEITGSSDASIKNPIVNNISEIIEKSNISKILFNGKKSYQIYQKFYIDKPQVETYILPSTSPANATYSYDRLLEEWKKYLL